MQVAIAGKVVDQGISWEHCKWHSETAGSVVVFDAFTAVSVVTIIARTTHLPPAELAKKASTLLTQHRSAGGHGIGTFRRLQCCRGRVSILTARDLSRHRLIQIRTRAFSAAFLEVIWSLKATALDIDHIFRHTCNKFECARTEKWRFDPYLTNKREIPLQVVVMR